KKSPVRVIELCAPGSGRVGRWPLITMPSSRWRERLRPVHRSTVQRSYEWPTRRSALHPCTDTAVHFPRLRSVASTTTRLQRRHLSSMALSITRAIRLPQWQRSSSLFDRDVVAAIGEPHFLHRHVHKRGEADPLGRPAEQLQIREPARDVTNQPRR